MRGGRERERKRDRERERERERERCRERELKRERDTIFGHNQMRNSKNHDYQSCMKIN